MTPAWLVLPRTEHVPGDSIPDALGPETPGVDAIELSDGNWRITAREKYSANASVHAYSGLLIKKPSFEVRIAQPS